MAKVEIEEDLLTQVIEWQRTHKVRRRADAVAALIEDGLALSSAEAGGFELAPVLRRQLVDGVADLERRIAAR